MKVITKPKNFQKNYHKHGKNKINQIMTVKKKIKMMINQKIMC